MKTVGLLGGMSWESTAEYYRVLNRTVQARLGGQHSAKIVMVSVDFDAIVQLQKAGDWERAGAVLGDAARQLERAGADFALLCTNTMHRVFDAIAAATPLPFVHLADATADALQRAGHRSVALLGTRFTMEQAFYRERLEARGMRVLVPDAGERDRVHEVIYDELCKGRILDASRAEYGAIIARLREAGATAVILGCTEITLLVSQADSVLPIFDTTRIHAELAVEMALA